MPLTKVYHHLAEIAKLTAELKHGASPSGAASIADKIDHEVGEAQKPEPKAKRKKKAKAKKRG